MNFNWCTVCLAGWHYRSKVSWISFKVCFSYVKEKLFNLGYWWVFLPCKYRQISGLFHSTAIHAKEQGIDASFSLFSLKKDNKLLLPVMPINMCGNVNIIIINFTCITTGLSHAVYNKWRDREICMQQQNRKFVHGHTQSFNTILNW